MRRDEVGKQLVEQQQYPDDGKSFDHVGSPGLVDAGLFIEAGKERKSGKMPSAVDENIQAPFSGIVIEAVGFARGGHGFKDGHDHGDRDEQQEFDDEIWNCRDPDTLLAPPGNPENRTQNGCIATEHGNRHGQHEERDIVRVECGVERKMPVQHSVPGAGAEIAADGSPDEQEAAEFETIHLIGRFAAILGGTKQGGTEPSANPMTRPCVSSNRSL